MSKPFAVFSILLLGMFALPLPPAPPALNAETANDDPSFRGDRRPGLSEISEEPTGENALLYRRIGKLRPDELLDLVSEEPSAPGDSPSAY